MWWKREPGDDFPFCARLTEIFKAIGVPWRVWQHCDELGIEEFEWSGANDHAARLEAGRALAAYINKVNAAAASRFGAPPILCLIGHSHGGNVILASLGYLDPVVRLLSIHFLGTPFFLYDDPGKWLRPRNVSAPLGPRNIYLTGYPKCHMRVWSFYSADEPYLLFRYLGYRRYFRERIRSAVAGLGGRPRWARIQRTVVWHYRRVIGLTRTSIDLPNLGVWIKTPSLAGVAIGYVRQTLAVLFWPASRLVLWLAAPLLSVMVSRRLFAAITGLNPDGFVPGRLQVSNGPGFDHHDFSWDSMVSTEAPRLSVKVDLVEDLLRLNADEEGLYQEMRAAGDRLNTLLRQIEVFHSAYYQSRRLIKDIALDILYRLEPRYPYLLEADAAARLAIFLEKEREGAGGAE